MKTVFFAKKEDYASAKNKLYADDLVSRQTIIVRESAAIGAAKDGYYILVEGDEKAIEKARDIVKDTASELKGKEADKVSSAIESQEESAASGFGAIFG